MFVSAAMPSLYRSVWRKALILPVDLRSYPDFWLRALGDDPKIEIADTNGQNVFLSLAGLSHPQGQGEEQGHP